VWGVRDVADDLKVLIPGTIVVSDAEIAHAVRTALQLDVMVPQDRIESTVMDGWVTLEGQVDLWRHFEDAERAVRHLAGVVGVSNKIKVTPSVISADQVHAAIEEAIERQAERTANHIRVAVRDGEVTMVGKVRSLREKQAVLEAVGHAPGVVVVDDQLIVDPMA
jgi:osmotically-inducible protein OsmY